MVTTDLLCSPYNEPIVNIEHCLFLDRALLSGSPVTLQKPTKPLLTDYLAIFGLWQGFNDIVAYALMWTFVVIKYFMYSEIIETPCSNMIRISQKDIIDCRNYNIE